MARLINANIAEESIRNAEKVILSEITCDYDRGWAHALAAVADLIARMPTVDAHRGCRGSGAWAVD